MFNTKFTSSDDRFGSQFDGYEVLKGEDGISPVVEVIDITGGHRIVITDKEGSTAFDVMDGIEGPIGPQGPQGEVGPKGAPGENGVNGKDGKDGYTPQRGIDYYTEADKAAIVQAVLESMPDGDEVSY